MTHIWYAFVIALTAVGSSYITTNLPALKRGFKRLFKRSKTQSTISVEARLSLLEHNVDNIAKALASRDRNRKSNIRRDVRDYLEELRTDKPKPKKIDDPSYDY